MKKFDVFGLGNALVDCVCLVDDKFLIDNNIEKGTMTLVDEKKQKLTIDKIINSNPFIQSGGSVINSIYTLSQLGGLGYASFLVSDDKFGKIYLNDLKESGVKMAETKYTVGSGMTGSCLVLTTPDAERTMNTCLSISSEFSIKNINFNDLKHAKYLYIEGYLVTSEKAMTAVHEVIDFSKENNVKIALTLSDVNMVKYFRDGFESILNKGIDILFCNEEEALLYSGSTEIGHALNFLLELSSLVIVTRGSKGSLIVSNGEKIKIDPYPADALDTVGAGDTFAGTFLYGINNNLSLRKSGDLASAMSSKVVSKLGPRLEKKDIRLIKQSIG